MQPTGRHVLELRGKRLPKGHDYNPNTTRENQLDGVLDALQMLVNAPVMLEQRQREWRRWQCAAWNARWRTQMQGSA